MARNRAFLLWDWALHAFAMGDNAGGKEKWQEARTIFEQLNLPLLVAEIDRVGTGSADQKKTAVP